MRNQTAFETVAIPHDYVSSDISGFAVSPGLTKILPIEKFIDLFRNPVYFSETVIYIMVGQNTLFKIGPTWLETRLTNGDRRPRQMPEANQ